MILLISITATYISKLFVFHDLKSVDFKLHGFLIFSPNSKIFPGMEFLFAVFQIFP